MIENPAIVVIAFDRPAALSRLLASLAGADYREVKGIPLVVSIDNGGSSEVGAIADEFRWKHGSKRVIKHNQPLGLREHVLFCGGLSREYGAVVVLEDDLVVSPYFYDFVISALSFYGDDERLCQVSLYSPQMNEFARRPFIPLIDGYDNYFIQSASSWGQVWTDVHWRAFREWYDEILKGEKVQWNGVPSMLEGWPASSWKKYFIKYMFERNLFAVYPRISLTTNWGDDGSHMQSVGARFQVPILLTPKKYRFSDFNESIAVYDAFFELKEDALRRIAPSLSQWKSIEADFYGLKRPCDIRAEVLISVKKCSKPIMSFGGQMQPPVSNVVFEVPGECFTVGKAKHFKALPYKIRLGILWQMMLCIGFGGMVRSLKRRARKYFQLKW